MSKNGSIKDFGCAVMACSVWVPAIVLAAEIEQKQVSYTHNESGAAIEEVMVTATRRAESLQKIPVSVTAFSGDEIKSLGLARAQDLTEQTPGLNFQGPFASANPQWSVRGVANNGFNANSVSAVGIYVDDVYLNAPTSHGVHLFDLQRVEVLRGPQGTLYGMNTTGGAINFIPQRPSYQVEGYLTGGFGSFAEKRLEGAVGGPLGQSVSGRLAFSRGESDGYRKNNLTGSDQAGSDSLALRGQLQWDVTDQFAARLNLHSASSESDLAYEQQGTRDPVSFAPCANGDIAAGRCVDFFGYSDAQQNPDLYEGAADYDSQDEVNTHGGALLLDWRLTGFAIKSITAFNRTEYDESSDDDMSPADFVLLQIESQAEQWTQEFRISDSGDDNLVWQLGLFYFQEDNSEYETVHGEAFAAPGVPRGGFYKEFDLEVESLAVYGELKYEWTERLSTRVGLRWTDESKEASYLNGYFATPGVVSSTLSRNFAADNTLSGLSFDRDESWSELSGHLSVDFAVNRDVLLFGSYTRGFRGGNFDLGLFSTQAIVDPERVEGVEVGFKSMWSDQRLRLNGAVYRYEYTDQQVTTVQGVNTTLSNAAESTNWGAELEVLALPRDGLTLRGGIAFMNAEYDRFIDGSSIDRSGNKLENSPEITLNGLIRYQWPVPIGMLSLQLDSSYKGGHFLDLSNSPLSRQDSFWLFNGRAAYQTGDGRFEVAAWVKNIGDEGYYRNWFDFSFAGFNQYTTGAPRTYGITASVYWD